VGLKCLGSVWGKLLKKIADLIEVNADEFAALETLDVSKYNLSITTLFLDVKCS
jgi:hypothetical protein